MTEPRTTVAYHMAILTSEGIVTYPRPFDTPEEAERCRIEAGYGLEVRIVRVT